MIDHQTFYTRKFLISIFGIISNSELGLSYYLKAAELGNLSSIKKASKYLIGLRNEENNGEIQNLLRKGADMVFYNNITKN